MNQSKSQQPLSDDYFKAIASEMELLFGTDIAHYQHEPLKFGFQIQLAQRSLKRKQTCLETEPFANAESVTESATETTGSESQSNSASAENGLNEQPSAEQTMENSVAATCVETPDTSSAAQPD
jgi:hypothetical protein